MKDCHYGLALGRCNYWMHYEVSGKVIKGNIERGEDTWQPINVRGHQIVWESDSLDIGIIHNLKVDRWAKCLELKLSKRSSRMKVVNSEMEPTFGFEGCRQPDWRSKLHHQIHTASLGLRVFVGGNTIYSWILFQMDCDFLKGQAFTQMDWKWRASKDNHLLNYDGDEGIKAERWLIPQQCNWSQKALTQCKGSSRQRHSKNTPVCH